VRAVGYTQITMFGDGSLTLREFAMREPLSLAEVQDAILDFLRNRDDAALFGAQAVNAYVDEPCMTQDVDILSTRAREFAEELRAHLAAKFTIAARVREMAGGTGFRVYQLRQPKNRNLAGVRLISEFPPTRLIAEIRVPTPEALIAQKLISSVSRAAQPKGDTYRRDLKVLLLAHPQLKTENGPVTERLVAAGAGSELLVEWKRLVALPIEAAGEEDEFEE
jgi:hypothetical protein